MPELIRGDWTLIVRTNPPSVRAETGHGTHQLKVFGLGFSRVDRPGNLPAGRGGALVIMIVSAWMVSEQLALGTNAVLTRTKYGRSFWERLQPRQCGPTNGRLPMSRVTRILVAGVVGLASAGCAGIKAHDARLRTAVADIGKHIEANLART